MTKKIILLFAAVFTLLFPTITYAKTNYDYTPKIITLNSDEVVDKDYFAGADTVEIFGTVNGDAYLAGGTVSVEGTVNGDVLAAGGTVTIAGNVAEDVRIVGGTVTISGNVEGNVTVGAGTIEITDGAIIGGSLVAGGGTLNVRAPVTLGATLGAGTLYLASSIGGDVNAGAETLRLAPSAEVDGDLNYWSEADVQIASEASVSGSVVKHQTNIPSEDEMQKMQDQTRKGAGRIFGAFKIVHILSFLLFGLVLAKLMPLFTRRVIDQAGTNPWAALGWGFLTLVVTPILAIVLFVTIIGFSLGGVLLAVWGLALYAAKYFAMVAVGEKLLPKFAQHFNLYQAFIVGLLLYTLLALIPVINFFASLTFLLFGLGGIALALKTKSVEKVK